VGLVIRRHVVKNKGGSEPLTLVVSGSAT